MSAPPPGYQEHFSDGVSEELLHLLARVPELRVAARTSSFSFRDQNLPIPVIADSLNVAHVLEGSVRKAGDQVRITAQLIRAEDGYHVWSDTWDRTLEYGDPGLSEIFLFPEFDALEDDPRWPAFLERIGMAPEDLEAIEFEVDLPEEERRGSATS